jgi:hypothetical protein
MQKKGKRYNPTKKRQEKAKKRLKRRSADRKFRRTANISDLGAKHAEDAELEEDEELERWPCDCPIDR